MSDERAACEVCGAPTQARIMRWGPTQDDPTPAPILVQHCSSLLCPTNLRDDTEAWFPDHDLGRRHQGA